MSLGPRRPCFACEPIVKQLEESLLRERASVEEIVESYDRIVAGLRARNLKLEAIIAEPWRGRAPVDLVLHCPACGKQHLDVGEFRTRVHRKHLCENTPEGPKTGCGHLWVPCEYATRGVLEILKPEDS